MDAPGKGYPFRVVSSSSSSVRSSKHGRITLIGHGGLRHRGHLADSEVVTVDGSLICLGDMRSLLAFINCVTWSKLLTTLILGSLAMLTCMAWPPGKKSRSSKVSKDWISCSLKASPCFISPLVSWEKMSWIQVGDGIKICGGESMSSGRGAVGVAWSEFSLVRVSTLGSCIPMSCGWAYMAACPVWVG